jgi:hypothetical protein
MSTCYASDSPGAELPDGVGRFQTPLWQPGHGPAHDAQVAASVTQADLGYLLELASVASRVAAEGPSRGDALLATYSVRLPRTSIDDFEAHGLRAHDCRLALAQLAPETS